MSTRRLSFKTLSKSLATIAPTIKDEEVRDAFAYVADFLHQRHCGINSEECAHVAEAFANKRTKVSKVLQKKLVGSKRQIKVIIKTN